MIKLTTHAHTIYMLQIGERPLNRVPICVEKIFLKWNAGELIIHGANGVRQILWLEVGQESRIIKLLMRKSSLKMVNLIVEYVGIDKIEKLLYMQSFQRNFLSPDFSIILSHRVYLTPLNYGLSCMDYLVSIDLNRACNGVGHNT